MPSHSGGRERRISIQGLTGKKCETLSANKLKARKGEGLEAWLKL
jgi:hypothetical protein